VPDVPIVAGRLVGKHAAQRRQTQDRWYYSNNQVANHMVALVLDTTASFQISNIELYTIAALSPIVSCPYRVCTLFFPFSMGYNNLLVPFLLRECSRVLFSIHA
jgi:hypothetical protein